MAEYIEREAVLKIIADNCPHDKCGYNTEEEMGAGAACYYIRKDVDNIPTADVVPKSEVERLYKEVDRLSQVVLYNDSVTEMKVAEAKQEVAREIFEEIERTFKALLRGDITDIEKILAKLKKKYTEGDNNGTDGISS